MNRPLTLAERRAVLERDGYRCRAPGCRATRAWLDGLRETLRAARFRRPRKIAALLRRYQVDDSPNWGLEVDHITPQERGGTNDMDNLVTLCVMHHDLKSNVGAAVRARAPAKYRDFSDMPDEVLREFAEELQRRAVPVKGARRHYSEAEWQAALARREQAAADAWEW